MQFQGLHILNALKLAQANKNMNKYNKYDFKKYNKEGVINMSETLLEIKNLHAKAGEKEIIKGLDLKINKGEVHVIMGPNGAGKSTLSNVILANPEYTQTEGDIILDGENINGLKTDERARKGIFMSFQSPKEIPGVSVANFLKICKNSNNRKTS